LSASGTSRNNLYHLIFKTIMVVFLESPNGHMKLDIYFLKHRNITRYEHLHLSTLGV